MIGSFMFKCLYKSQPDGATSDKHLQLHLVLKPGVKVIDYNRREMSDAVTQIVQGFFTRQF